MEAVLEDLQEVTAVQSPDAVSLIPRNLEISNTILNMSLDFLMNDLASNPSNPIPLSVVRRELATGNLENLVNANLHTYTLIAIEFEWQIDVQNFFQDPLNFL